MVPAPAPTTTTTAGGRWWWVGFLTGSPDRRRSSRRPRRPGVTDPHRLRARGRTVRSAVRGRVGRRPGLPARRGRGGGRRRPRRGRRRDPLGRGELRRLGPAAPRRGGRARHPGGPGRHPRRRAGPTGPAADVGRPGLPPGRPLRGPERHAGRPPGGGPLALVHRAGPPRPPLDRGAPARMGTPLGRHRPDLRGHGRVQLAGPPGQPPDPAAVALPRAPPLPGGHERAHGLPHASPDPRLVPPGPGARRRAAGQRHGPHAAARGLRRLRRLRALEHEPRLRTAGADLRQPELPPHPPPARRPPGRQPRLRPHHLGPAFPPARLPHRGDDPDRHRTAGPPARRRAVRVAPRHLEVLAAQLWGPFRPLDRSGDDVGGRRPAPATDAGTHP